VKRIAVLAAALATVALVPRAGYAQSAGRLSVGGTIEYARITDDDSFLGAGVGGGASVGLWLTDATAVEIEVGRTRHVRDLDRSAIVRDAQGRFDHVPYTERWQGTATFAVATVAHTFGHGRVRPVVWGGGGLMSHGGTVRGPAAALQVPSGFSLQPGDGETRRGSSSRAGTIDGGVGFEVRVAPRVTLRPFAGLRLVSTGNVGPKYVIRTGVRVGVH
jgi:hypothetical protein